MSIKRGIILLEYTENKTDFNFSSDLMTNVRTKTGQYDTIYSLDNHSDMLSTQYALALMDNVDEVVLIADLAPAEQLGALDKIIGQAARSKKEVKLIQIGESKALSPFLKFLECSFVDTAEELEL